MGTIIEAISINGQVYRLARQRVLERAGLASARRWREERRPIATKVVSRPDVRASDIPGEYIITWDDWSRGIAGDHENIPGCVHWTKDVETIYRGALRSISNEVTQTGSGVDWGGTPRKFIKFNDTIFLLAGRKIWRLDINTWSTEQDFGAVVASDAVEHNNLLVVCFTTAAGDADKLRTRDTAGTWSGGGAADDAVYATYLSVAPDGKLWRASDTNKISNIESTDDPLTLLNWSAKISVGDDDIPITALNHVGGRIAVSKEDGLYLGDASQVFENVLAGIGRDHLNGRPTLVIGDSIFYKHRHGLIRYSNGVAEEIGIATQFPSASSRNLGSVPIPGTTITALTAQGRHLWAATAPSLYPRSDPVGFLKTTDGGLNYVDYTSQVSDNNHSTVADLGSLDTWANGDAFYIGDTSPFWGFTIELESPNTNAGVTLTVEYWNGTAWAAWGIGNPVIDQTTGYGGDPEEGSTLTLSGAVTWPTQPSSWTQSTINGITAYWVRCTVSSALGAATQISEARVITQQARSYILRGRPREPGDVRSQSVIWQTVFTTIQCTTPYISALYVSDYYPFKQGSGLLAASRQRLAAMVLPRSPQETTLDGESGVVFFQRHDAGMPEFRKQFLSFTIKGRILDSNHTVNLRYNLDEQNNTWTLAESDIATSPRTITLSNVTGYAIQPRIAFNTVSHDDPTEINELECRFRALPTMKNVYTAMLEIADGQSGLRGGVLPDADVQLSNLEALQGTANVSLLDPAGRSKTVTVSDVQVIELMQHGEEPPSFLVQVTMAEI